MRQLLGAVESTVAAVPDADLAGIDLGSGRPVMSDQFGLQWVEWTRPPVGAHAFAASLHSTLPSLFEALGLGPAPSLERRTDRRWTPMDGAEPPWCPFTDTTVDAGIADDGSPISLEIVLNHWNEDEIANASVSLTIGDRVRLSAYGSVDGGDVDTLRLRRPTTAAVVAAVSTLVR